MKFLKRLFSKPNRGYVSEMDTFLESLKQKVPALSDSQKKLINKYARLVKLRDKGEETPDKPVPWDKF
ncbi:MAG: hypothetical protein K0R12_646 [Gammaproteobacteria bacterium]|jgi:hypothetical protein|nr:hypothetical protein [Gammaproteobacteria bacterium]